MAVFRVRLILEAGGKGGRERRGGRAPDEDGVFRFVVVRAVLAPPAPGDPARERVRIRVAIFF